MPSRGLRAALFVAFALNVAAGVMTLLPHRFAAGPRVSTAGLLLAGAVATIALVRRGWRDPAYRRAWLLLTVAMVSETAWLIDALYPSIWHRALAAQPAGNVGHLIAVPFLIAALLGLPTAHHDRRTRLRTSLDALAASCAFGALTYNFGAPEGVNHLGALQPICGMALGTTIVAVLARARFEGGLELATLLSVVSGVFLLGLAAMLASEEVSRAGWSPQDWCLLIGAFGQLLLAYASLRPVEAR